MTDTSQSLYLLKKALQVTFGGLGQAVLCIFFGNAVVMMLLLILPPLLLLEADATGHFLLTALAFAFVSLWVGHRFPHLAFLRSGIAFCFAVAIDLYLISSGNTGIMLRKDSELTNIEGLVAVVGAGTLVCALAGAVGVRLKRDFYGWIREEMREFTDSISHHTSSIGPECQTAPLTPCRAIEEHLPLYVTGKQRMLPPEIKHLVEEHLTICEHCQERLADLAEKQRSSRRYRKTRALHDGPGM